MIFVLKPLHSFDHSRRGIMKLKRTHVQNTNYVQNAMEARKNVINKYSIMTSYTRPVNILLSARNIIDNKLSSSMLLVSFFLQLDCLLRTLRGSIYNRACTLNINIFSLNKLLNAQSLVFQDKWNLMWKVSTQVVQKSTRQAKMAIFRSKNINWRKCSIIISSPYNMHSISCNFLIEQHQTYGNIIFIKVSIAISPFLFGTGCASISL